MTSGRRLGCASLLCAAMLGCAAHERYGEHQLVPWMGDRELNIIDRLDLSLESPQYDGFGLVGRVVLTAADVLEVPRVLDHRTLSLRHVWDCESGQEVPERVHVDYLWSDEFLGFQHLTAGESFSEEHVRFPVFSHTFMPGGGPDCIGFLIVYSPNGWFVGANTATYIGKVHRTPASHDH